MVDYDVIKEMIYSVEKDRVVFRWFWPFELESVFIRKVRNEEELDTEGFDVDIRRVYTREEYKVRQCYIENSRDIGEFIYAVYPIVEENGEKFIIDQSSRNNRITVSERKLDIYYKITEKKKLFSGIKKVAIEVESKIFLEKETLCYVKNQGCIPNDVNDGFRFEFNRGIDARINYFRDILIGKNEYVEVFLSSKDYEKTYNLVKREGV